MALIDQVKDLCDRLATLGWRDFLKAVTGNALDIKRASTAALSQELTKNLAAINRNMTGLDDFAPGGNRAVTAGQPSLSLLYHVLASPLVVRDQDGNAFGGFATLAELEILEDFIFSLSPVSLPQFINQNGGLTNVAVVVFSTDYRPAADSVDGRHADLTFSRTGIARVGTASPRYLPESRGFWPEDEDNPHNIRVLPSRFSAWLAVKKRGAETRVSPILDGQGASGEADRDFWVPVHKLFPGNQCITGLHLSLTFSSKLFNLKIQRVHQFLGTSPLPSTFPYVIRDAEIGSMSSAPDLGPGWLVPKVRASLVEPAILNGKPLTYKVTRGRVDGFAAFNPGDDSGFPNYVHARTRVRNGQLEDLNDEPDVIRAMKEQQQYQALHYIDFTGEGWVEAAVPQLTSANLAFVPAYALVSAPDFYPSAGQFELSEWSRSNQIPAHFRETLWSIRPTPLSETRLPANLQLPNTPFKPADETITALVGMGAPSGTPAVWPVQPDARRTTCLPDDAAGVFAPGWDVGRDTRSGVGDHLAAYALGSPFPEDAKLCAALSTFWPAVAPDVFRTFIKVIGNANGSIAPMIDEEIGQSGTLPWDGIPGPREVTVNGKLFVEFPSFLNADYVRQAVENRFSIRPTASISTEEYQSRILAACRIYSVAGSGDVRRSRNRFFMLSFREVASADSSLQQAQMEAGIILSGRVYAARLCEIVDFVAPKINARTERMPLENDSHFFASPTSLMVLHCCPVKTRTESTGWNFRLNRPGSPMLPRPVKWALSRKE